MPRRSPEDQAEAGMMKLIRKRDRLRNDLAQTEARIAEIVKSAGLVQPPAMPVWPASAPEAPQGPSTDLSPADQQGEGRWL